MPITMPGLSSGIETDDIVEKLRKVEEQPIKRYEAQIQDLQTENLALEELNKKTIALEMAIKSLYGFDAPFQKKIIISEPEGFMDGIANNGAETGEHELEILNIASNLTIRSNEVQMVEKFPATKITVNNNDAQFEGGSLEDLKTFFQKNFMNELDAKIVTKNKDVGFIILESKKSGKSGILKLSDSNGLLENIELIKQPGFSKPDAKSEKVPVEKKEEFSPVTFTPEKLIVTNDGPASVSDDKKSLQISEKAERTLELDLPMEEYKEIKGITIKVKKTETEKENDDGPFNLTNGPVDIVNIKGIELSSYNITRTRPEPEVINEEFDYGIITNEGKKISLKDKGELVQIPLDENPDKIGFYTNNADVTFRDVQLVYEIPREKPENNDDNSEQINEISDLQKEQENMFPHILKLATNSKLKIDGIEIERDKNREIDDLLPGSSINLVKPTETPIQIAVSGNTPEIFAHVSSFLETYNDLLKYTKDITLADKTKEMGKFDEAKKNSGILVTNSTVRGLVNGLRKRVSDAYPAVRDPKIKILSAVGITSGEVGAKWADISNGYLMMNEKVFTELVSSHPEAVAEFFALDKNGDRRYDNGLAYNTAEYLKPYTRQVGGIIGSQINSNKEQIAKINLEIAKKKDHVQKYADNLKAKFGHMESMIQEQKSTEKFLKQRFKTNDD